MDRWIWWAGGKDGSFDIVGLGKDGELDLVDGSKDGPFDLGGRVTVDHLFCRMRWSWISFILWVGAEVSCSILVFLSSSSF